MTWLGNAKVLQQRTRQSHSPTGPQVVQQCRVKGFRAKSSGQFDLVKDHENTDTFSKSYITVDFYRLKLIHSASGVPHVPET